MKKIIAMVLTLAMLFALATPAFADTTETRSEVLIYSLETDGSTPEDGMNVAYAQAGDTITVYFVITLTNTDSDDQIEVSTGQEEILYDQNFFERVDDSVVVENYVLDKDEDPDWAIDFSKDVKTATPDDGDEKNTYFNWTSNLLFYKDWPYRIGHFQLKVKEGASGFGMVWSKPDRSFAQDNSKNFFGKQLIDLKVIYGTGPVAVTGISIDETVNLYVGGEQTLTATITPDNATNTNVTWESSNTAVATVDATGKVTAVAEGTANITATSNNGKSDTCAVTVSRKTPTTSPTNPPKAEVK